MAKYVLADIQALIASPDYGGWGQLQPSSAVLGLSAALDLRDMSNWQGAGYDLTDDEIDEIDAMIALLENDLMANDDMATIDFCKLTFLMDQTISNNVNTSIQWGVEIYNPDGMFDYAQSRFDIFAVNDGLHFVDLIIRWSTSAVGVRRIQLYKYDAEVDELRLITRTRQTGASGTAGYMQSISTQVLLKVGDFLNVSVFQQSGGNLTISAGEIETTFAVARVG